MTTKPTVTRAEIIDHLCKQTNVSRGRAADLLECMIDIICDELSKGQSVRIVRFGSFRLHKKKARIGRNPKTGKEAPISARNVVTFKPSTLLRRRISAAKPR